MTSRRPRALFDATHLSRLTAGVSTYIVELLSALAALPDRDWDLVVLATPEHARTLERHAPAAELCVVPIASAAHRIVWEQTGLPRLTTRLGAGLLHSPHYSLPLRAAVRKAVTVHDLTYLSMPERHRVSRRWFFQWMIPRAARAADHVFCVSRVTCDDLFRLVPGLDRARASVVHLAAARVTRPDVGADQLRQVTAEWRLPERFVLQVGTVEPRKNVATAIAAVEAVRARQPDVELVLAGQRGWESDALFRTIEATPFVRYLGHVPDHVLTALYSLATVLIMPSHYEGFGLPVVEALAVGLPVVTSGKGSLGEVGGAAALVPAGDHPSAYGAALLEVLENPSRRAELRARGKAWASYFSWERAADETRIVYDRLLGCSAVHVGRPQDAGR